MGIFDFFGESSSPELDSPQITVTPKREDSAVFAQLDWNDTEPGEESELDGVTAVTLSLLDLLDTADLAEQREEYTYEIPFSSIPDLDSVASSLLGLQPAGGWATEVRVRGVIGRGDPEIYLTFTAPDGTYDVVDRGLVESVACGFWSLRNDELVVLPSEIIELRRRCQQGPDNLNEDRQAAAFRYVAEVKELALKARDELGEESVDIADQLLDEEFVAADTVRPQVERSDDGGFELYPTVDGFDDEKGREELLEARERKELFTDEEGQKKTRIALSPQCRREVNRVRKRHRVPPEDVRAFLRDPRSYIQPPEELAEERREIAETRDLSIDEVEESADFDPDSALDLESVEQLLEGFDADRYGDRVVGIEAKSPTLPDPESAKSTDLGDWSGTKDDESTTAQSDSDQPDTDADSSPQRETSDDTASESPETTDNDRTDVEQEDQSTTVASDKSAPDGTPADGISQARLVTIDNDEEAEFIIQARQRLRRHFEDFGGEPELFDGDLYRPFQTEGYAWLRELEAMEDAGGLLADDMGMGKTVQIVALLSYLAAHEELSPTLLVVPKSTLQNWQSEIAEFCHADLDCYEHLGSSRYRSTEPIAERDVVLTTYATLRNDQIVLGEIRFNVMVCDEAQKIKNYTSGRATACRAMDAGLRVALTATPVENGLVELWSIFDFCQPGRLDSMATFKEQYVEPIETGDDSTQQQAARSLLEQMDPHFLRRTKEQHLGEQLPDKFVHRQPVSMSDAQQARYDMVRQWYTPGSGNALGAIQAMLRICAHPDALSVESEEKIGLSPRPLEEVLKDPEEVVERSKKFQFVVDQLRDIEELNERAILFCRQRTVQAMLDVVMTRFFDVRPATINGDVSAGKRQQIVDRFNQSTGFNVIILSPRAAGVGINVTGANHVFHVTREWNPAVENQATDRAYRIGQQKDVHVYVPITEHPDDGVPTLDERLDELLEAKREIADSTIVPRGVGRVSQADLEEGIE